MRSGKKDCCDKAMQGTQGPQGVQGPVGPAGIQGPQGVQGPQGIDGSCISCGGVTPPVVIANEYAQIYSLLSQTLSASTGSHRPGQAITFENTVVSTSNIDTSASSSTGLITINKLGWYNISQSVCGTLTNLSSPLSNWGFALFQNGVIVPGTTFAAMTLSPDQISNTLTANFLIHAMAGDTISLNNITSLPLTLAHTFNGLNTDPVSASLQIKSVDFI
jgi:hypothetical protein